MSTTRNIAFFLTAVFLAKAVGFLQSFVLAHLLGPVEFGFWVTLLLVVSYSPIACLGTVEAMLKQVPFWRGNGSLERTKQIEGAVLGSVALASLFFLLLGLGVTLIPGDTVRHADRRQISLILITVSANFFSSFFYCRFVAYENFKAASLMEVLRSGIGLIFIAGLSWLWGLPGAVVGYLLHEIAICLVGAFSNIRLYGTVRIDFSRKLLAHAVRVGLPITVLWWILGVQGGIDRIVLGSFVGAKEVGYYALGLSVVSILGLVPMVIGRVLYPKVNRQFGESPDTQSMIPLVLSPTLALATLLANLQALVLCLAPILYNLLLPKYQPGLLAGQILLLGSFFVCLLRNGANYLIATHKEQTFLKYILVAVFVNVVADVGFVKIGWGIEGVAVGTSISGFLLTTLVWRRVFVGLGFDRLTASANVVRLYYPIAALIGGAILLRSIYPECFEIFRESSLLICVALCTFVNGLVYFSPVYRYEMRTWVNAISLKTKSIARMAEPTTPIG